MAKFSNIQTQQQKIVLTQAQIQGLQILTLQSIQLEQRIERELEENPALEQDKDLEEQDNKDTTLEDYIKSENNDSSYHYKSNAGPDSDNKSLMLARLTSDGKTVSETLQEQLVYLNFNEKETGIANFLIGTLDPDGYLRRDNRTLSDDLIFTQGIDATPDEIEKVILSIQKLDPPGIAARTLKECLLLQLIRLESTEESIQNAILIIKNHYDNFVNKRYETIMNKTGLEKEDLKDAIEIITSLNPKPANGFNDDIMLGQSQTISPDFFVNYNEDDDNFDITIAGDEMTKLKISKSYIRLASDLKKDGGKETKEAVDFISQKIRSAEWFIASLKQRRETLSKTVTAIVEREREYFITGDQETLRPMVLKDIAEVTGYDISTIWRVVDGKYVQTRFGIFCLKDLFSGGYTTSDGTEVSAKSIKGIIKARIDNEDPLNPLTDQQLMEILKEEGYDIARRTIAKYREQLSIPVARLRKKL